MGFKSTISLFVDINGVQVHYKLADSSTEISIVGTEEELGHGKWTF